MSRVAVNSLARSVQRGSVLLPVVVAITLLAAVTFMLSYQGVSQTNIVVGEFERDRLRFVAEAGLAHAKVELAKNTSCDSYVDIPKTDFGGDSYSAQLSPNKGSPVKIKASVELASGKTLNLKTDEIATYQSPTTLTLQFSATVGKDVNIDSFYPNANYGGHQDIIVRSKASWIQRPLLEFDVSAIPGGVKILSARLELALTSLGTPGVIGIHRMTRSWEEGTGKGTGNADGATWNDYESNLPWSTPGGDFDSALYAETSVSSAKTGGWVSWEIRDLVDDWVSGSFQNFGLVLVGDGTVDNAQFASREDGDPTLAPRLVITYACECGDGKESTTSLGPGADTYIADGSDENNNFGTEERVRLSNKSNSNDRALLHFDLSGVSPAAVVTSATLEMNLEGIGSGAAASVDVHRATTPWSEGSATWNQASAGTPWLTPGGDYDVAVEATAAIDPLAPGPTFWDVTALVTSWVDGTVDNNGFMLHGSFDVNHADFTTKDSTNASAHPKLSVTVSCPCGTTCLNSPGSGGSSSNVLFVVGSVTGAGPTAAEEAHRALLESWGYTVEYIDDNASQSEFDTAFATSDVVFVTNDVTASNIGNKLNAATIGVVTSEVNLHANLGISDLVGWDSGTSIDIKSPLHFISEPFPTGPLTILKSTESLAYMIDNFAPDLAKVAAIEPGPAIGAIDTGENTLSGPAPGRRVLLPWGGNGFDPDNLNADGLTILERTIEWGIKGGGATASAPVAHWKLDDGTGTTAIDSAGGNDGTLINGPVWVAGQDGDALDFDGINDYVAAGTFDITGSGLTLTAWFNAETIPTTDGRFISKASGPTEAEAWWQMSTTDVGADRYLRMRIKAGGTTTTFHAPSTNLTSGQWYFAVATYDNSGAMKLYLDGTEVASTTHAVGGPVDVDPSVPVAIGANGTAERFFDGVLDDVRIYNRALSASEVSDLYASGGGGGGGACDGNYLDQFEVYEFNNSDGSLDWSTSPWEEVGESDGPTAGDIRIWTDLDSVRIRTRDNDNGGEGLEREADLSGAASATLSYDYRRDRLDSSEDYTLVEVSANGAAGPWIELARYAGPTNDDAYQSASHDIGAYIASNTRIRFKTSSSMGGLDHVWFDNVDIVCTP